MFRKFCFIVTVLLILAGMTACGTEVTEGTIPTEERSAALPSSKETENTAPIAPTDDEEPITSPTEELPAMEHDMEMSYTASTTEAEGVEVATCKRCGYEVRQILEKLPVLATNADASEIEALIIKYINEYRT